MTQALLHFLFCKCACCTVLFVSLTCDDAGREEDGGCVDSRQRDDVRHPRRHDPGHSLQDQRDGDEQEAVHLFYDKARGDGSRHEGNGSPDEDG